MEKLVKTYAGGDKQQELEKPTGPKPMIKSEWDGNPCGEPSFQMRHLGISRSSIRLFIALFLGENHLVPGGSEAPFSSLILDQGFDVFLFSEVRPVGRGHVDLGVGNLPEEKNC